MSDETNIIQFKGRKLGTKNEHSKEYRCHHQKLLADKDFKVLECESCGFIYTPWEYVWKLATNEERIFMHIKHAKEEKNRLDGDLVDLKRQIRNAKAQLRRLNK